jgi:hypothetical protein
MVMMVMTMGMAKAMAIVMVLVIVIIVPEVLRQVGWLCQRQHQSFHRLTAFYLVLATGPGNPPAVWVWTGKTGQFGSRTVQKPDPQTLGRPNPNPYPSTARFRPIWLDPSVQISGSAFRVSHLWLHSDMLLIIVIY